MGRRRAVYRNIGLNTTISATVSVQQKSPSAVLTSTTTTRLTPGAAPVVTFTQSSSITEVDGIVFGAPINANYFATFSTQIDLGGSRREDHVDAAF